MFGFKEFYSAGVTLNGIELVRMKNQKDLRQTTTESFLFAGGLIFRSMEHYELIKIFTIEPFILFVLISIR
jgi:hypothetical protein